MAVCLGSFGGAHLFSSMAVRAVLQLSVFGKGSCNFSEDHTKYSTLIYKSTLANCRFSSALGQVVVAVEFLTRDPPLMWNTDMSLVFHMFFILPVLFTGNSCCQGVNNYSTLHKSV